MANIFVTTLEKSLHKKLLAGLQEQEFEIAKPQYTVFQAKKTGITCTLYTSGKLTVQGKKMREFIEFYLEPEILLSPEYTYHKELKLESMDKRTRIGVDEAGKGDYFGPLCVAGIAADEKILPILLELGIRDSKDLTDKQIRKIAPQIVTKVPNYIIRLKPQKYNELYASFRNLNTLLAWCHATVIEHLHSHAPIAIVDKFAHERVVETALRKKNLPIKVEQRTKAESDIVVASASILARWAFIEEMDTMSKELNITLPKGSSRAVVQKAKQAVHEYGEDILKSIAKMHFKITHEII